MTKPLFPVARWLGVLWLAIYAPVYAVFNGPANFLFLCDVSVFLVVGGLWQGSALLLSSQAVACLLVSTLWTLDVLSRLLTGAHLIGGTEYMWDATIPLFVRLLSCFHAALPLVALAAVRRTGYDRRGVLLQSGVAVAAVAAGRLVGPQANINYSFTAPFFGRALGPAPLHVAVIAGTLVLVVYPLTHLALKRLFAPAATE
jgi:hypothetical protein